MGVGSWVVIAIIGIILLLFSLVRRRSGAAKYPDVVQALLYDIKLNQALATHYYETTKIHRFENSNWLMNKDKISFLGESAKTMLREIYVLVDEYNVKIKAAQKAKDDSYKSIDVTRFRELLEKCRQELEDWMVLKTGQKELPPKYPTLMGTLFGER